jgi:predicted nuclease of restriction endonuclease-like RecB superfamily
MITLGAWACCALTRQPESNIAKATASRLFTRGNMVFLLSVPKWEEVLAPAIPHFSTIQPKVSQAIYANRFGKKQL